MSDNIGMQATPHVDLIAQVMDSRVPKNEREWAAADEIERLRAEIKELKSIVQEYIEHTATLQASNRKHKARVAELERDIAYYQRAVKRACEIFENDVQTQDVDSITSNRVGLYLATYSAAIDAAMQEQPHE